MLGQRHQRAALGGVHRAGGRVAVNQRPRFSSHLSVDEQSLFVLGLRPPQGRLQGHDPLPLRRQAALFAAAVAIPTVALVSLQADLETVVAAAGTVRRRSGVQTTAGRSTGVGSAVVPCFRHLYHPTVFRNHQPCGKTFCFA